MFTLSAIISQQSSVGGNIQTSANTKSVNLQWRHDFNADLSLSSYAAYTTQAQAGGKYCFGTLASACAGGPTTTESLVFGVSLNYNLTETVTANCRYLFSDRISSTPNLSMYQDLIVVGITKHF
jgi:hypothetical protein